MLQQLATAAGRFEVLRRLNGKRGEGHLRQEGRIGGAQAKLDGQRIDGGDLLHQASVTLGFTIGAVDHQITGRFFGRFFSRFFATSDFGCCRYHGRREFGRRRLKRRREFGRRRLKRRRYLLNRLLDTACTGTGSHDHGGDEK